MLKDVEESRRITRAIQGHFGDETAQTLDVTVASRAIAGGSSSGSLASGGQ